MKTFYFIFAFMILASSAQAETSVTFVERTYQELSAISARNQQSMDSLPVINKTFDFGKLFDIACQDFCAQLNQDDYSRIKTGFSETVALNLLAKTQSIAPKDMRITSIQEVSAGANEPTKSVQLTGTKADAKLTLLFTLVAYESSWKIIDLSVNGVLLSRNYRARFNKIHRVEGPAGLYQRIEEKLVELKSGLTPPLVKGG